MQVFDYKKSKLVSINSPSDVIPLLNQDEINTLFTLLFHSTQTLPNYFITISHFKRLFNKYNKNITQNISKFDNLSFLSHSISKCTNQTQLLKILNLLHFNNYSIQQLINKISPNQIETLINF